MKKNGSGPVFGSRTHREKAGGVYREPSLDGGTPPPPTAGHGDPPPDLSASALSDWPGLLADVTATTGAAAVDLALLAELLRVRDRLQQVRAALDRDGLVVPGSTGQSRPHPLLATESLLRRELADAYARLQLTPSTRHIGRRIGIEADGRLTRY